MAQAVGCGLWAATHAHLIEAHALLDLGTEAHRVGHGARAQAHPAAPWQPRVRLVPEAEPHQGRGDEEEG